MLILTNKQTSSLVFDSKTFITQMQFILPENYPLSITHYSSVSFSDYHLTPFPFLALF